MPLALFIGNTRIITYKDPQTFIRIVTPDTTLPPVRLCICHLDEFHGHIVWQILHEGEKPVWAPFGHEVAPPFSVGIWASHGAGAVPETVPFWVVPGASPYLAAPFDSEERYTISINEDEADTFFEFQIPSRDGQEQPLTRFKTFDLRPTPGFTVVADTGEELFDWNPDPEGDPSQQEEHVINIVSSN